jgi:hypothetical protein
MGLFEVVPQDLLELLDARPRDRLEPNRESLVQLGPGLLRRLS